MDIQEMVDRRIRELQAESNQSHQNRFEGATSFFPGNGDERAIGRQQELGKSPHLRTPTITDSVHDLASFGDVIDAALAQVARQVLEITEQLAGDYAQLEKHILKSRLELLSSVESVLDTALALRREVRGRLGAIYNGPCEESLARPASSPRHNHKEPPVLQENSRATMHDGVAALFRRTL